MYYTVNTFERFSELNIDGIGCSDENNLTRFGPGTRLEHVAMYVLSGSGFFNDIPLSKGQGFIHLSHTQGFYCANPSDPWTILWVVTNDNKFKHMLKYYNVDENTGVFNYDFVDQLLKIVDYLKENSFTRVNRAKMLELYMSILTLHFPQQDTYNGVLNRHRYIDYAENYIHSHYHMDLKVSDLTKRLGIGQPYLYKLFMKHYGVSPKQYIMEYRIRHAKTLLIETDLQVSTIANSVGYADSHEFSKIFSNKVGMSPMKYRNEHLPK